MFPFLQNKRHSSKRPRAVAKVQLVRESQFTLGGAFYAIFVRRLIAVVRNKNDAAMYTHMIKEQTTPFMPAVDQAPVGVELAILHLEGAVTLTTVLAHSGYEDQQCSVPSASLPTSCNSACSLVISRRFCRSFRDIEDLLAKRGVCDYVLRENTLCDSGRAKHFKVTEPL